MKYEWKLHESKKHVRSFNCMPIAEFMTHANAWSDLGILETTAMLYASAFLMAFNSATGLESVHQFSEF